MVLRQADLSVLLAGSDAEHDGEREHAEPDERDKCSQMGVATDIHGIGDRAVTFNLRARNDRQETATCDQR